MKIPSEIQAIVQKIHEVNGTCYLVGGVVRDLWIGGALTSGMYELNAHIFKRKEPTNFQDLDIEVFGIPVHRLREILEPFGPVNTVGKAHGCMKMKFGDYKVDFTIPRRDNKVGSKHTEFEHTYHPDMSPQEATLRRDFTMNAMMLRLYPGQNFDDIGGFHLSTFGHDFHKGSRHLSLGQLVPVSNETFGEDPLRLLRGMQFASRFGLVASSELVDLFTENDGALVYELRHLPKDRIYAEWEKWATRSRIPSLGLRYLEDTGILKAFPYTIINDLATTPQDPEWHPEGNVFIHTCHAVDAANDICDRENASDDERITVMFGALCHDFGKPGTTRHEDGRVTSKRHSIEGVGVAHAFLSSIGMPEFRITRILPLIEEHLIHANKDIHHNLVRRLATRMKRSPKNFPFNYNGTIRELLFVIEADASARPPLPGGLPEECKKIEAIAKELELEKDKPKPIVMGRHLIEVFHMSPSKRFKAILNACMEKQLDGEITNLDEGLAFVTSLLTKEPING